MVGYQLFSTEYQTGWSVTWLPIGTQLLVGSRLPVGTWLQAGFTLLDKSNATYHHCVPLLSPQN
jgi:hypothetical protein